MRQIILPVFCFLLWGGPSILHGNEEPGGLPPEIGAALNRIEAQLNRIEHSFWRDVYSADTGSKNFLKSAADKQDINAEIVAFRTSCGQLQGSLGRAGVDIKFFTVEKGAIQILNIWKEQPALRQLMLERKDSATKRTLRWSPGNLNRLVFTGRIPPGSPNYGDLLDEIAIVNMELFYPDCPVPHLPPGFLPGEGCRHLVDDNLTSSAGEFYMAVRDLRVLIYQLRTDPFGVERRKSIRASILRVESDLNRIEREFWDTIYKSELLTARNVNQLRTKEFHQLLYRFQVECRDLQAMLRNAGMDAGLNVTEESIVIYDIGRSKDRELRGRMRNFFNRANPLLPGEKKEREKYLYHFRASDSTLPPPAEGEGHWSSSSVPSANLVMMNVSPAQIGQVHSRNVAIFRGASGEFKALEENAVKYFGAVASLRIKLFQLKRQFPEGAPEPVALRPALTGEIKPEPAEKKRPVQNEPEAEEEKEILPSLLFPEEPEPVPPEDDALPGELYRRGIRHLMRDQVKLALHYLRRAAGAEVPAAQYALFFFRENRLVRYSPADSSAAREYLPYLEKAAEQGYIPAIEDYISIHDFTVPEHREKALRYAAQSGLLWKFARRMAAMPDPEREAYVAEILKRAIADDTACQTLLSYCFGAEDITEHSPEMSRAWLFRAAGKGQMEARLHFWGWHTDGSAGTENPEWLDRASASGGVPAIAFRIMNGRGSQEILTKLEEAGARGDEVALRTLSACLIKMEKPVSEWRKWEEEWKCFRFFREKIGKEGRRHWGILSSFFPSEMVEKSMP